MSVNFLAYHLPVTPPPIWKIGSYLFSKSTLVKGKEQIFMRPGVHHVATVQTPWPDEIIEILVLLMAKTVVYS